MRRPFLVAVSLTAVLVARGAWADLQAGIAAYDAGKYAEAEAQLREATGVDADAYLAAALAKQKKYAEAEPKAKAALAENATHAVGVAALGNALVGLKKYDEAVEKLSAAIEKKDDLAYAYFWRAQAYEGQKQVSRMAADYQMFLKLAPKAAEAPGVQATLAALK